MKATKKNTEKRDLIIKLLNANPPLRKEGTIDWETLYHQHPGLRKKLDATTPAGRTRLSVLVADLREAGAVPRSGSNAPTLNGHASRLTLEKTPPAQLDPKQTADLLRNLIPNYVTAPGQSIPWKQIWIDHPGYKALLGYEENNKYSLQSLSSLARKIIRKDLPHLDRKAPLKKSAPAAVETAAPAPSDCLLTGPGLRIEFPSRLLPTLLHTIALAMGGKTK